MVLTINTLITYIRRSQGCDHQEVEAALSDFCRLTAIKPPQFLWFESPLAAALAILSLRPFQKLAAEARSSDGKLLKPHIALGDLMVKLLDQNSMIPTVEAYRNDGLKPFLLARAKENIAQLTKEDLSTAVFPTALEAEVALQISSETARSFQGKALDRALSDACLQLLVEVGTDTGTRSTKSVTRSIQRYFEKRLPHDEMRQRLRQIDVASWRIQGPLARETKRALLQFVSSDVGHHVDGLTRFSAEAFRQVLLLSSYLELTNYRGMPSPTVPSLTRLFSDVGWLGLFQQTFFVSKKPFLMSLDSQGRPHAENGPALEYTDGWRLWMWHGTPIDKRIITDPGSITVEEICFCANKHIRSVLLDRYGVNRFLKNSDARLVHADEFGELYHLSISYVEPVVLVRIHFDLMEQDRRFKEFFIRVPPDMKTAREAVAWTYAMSTAQLQIPHNS